MRQTLSNTRISGMVLILAASGMALAQDPSQSAANSDQFGQSAAQAELKPARPAYGLPPQVTVKPHTYLTVRVNQPLSSDHSRVGDTFSATLAQPLVADGVVLAQRGQMVYGRVAVAQKAHGGKDSQLGLELSSLTLADGSQQPVGSQLIGNEGPRTPGTVEAGTNAGAGAAAVLATHNHETRLHPESVLTFQVTTPLTVSTANAPQAFRFVGPEDYQRAATQYSSDRPTMVRRAPASYYYDGPGSYPYYYGYPYYWGPSIMVGGWGGWGGGYRGGFGRWR